MPGYGPTPPPGWPTNRPWPPTSKADLTLLGLLGRDVTRASKGLAEAFKSIPGLAKEFYDYAKGNPVRAGLDLTPPGAAVESILMGGKAGQALATGGAKIALPMLGMAMLGTHTGSKLPKFRSAAIKLADGSIYGGALHFNAVEEAMSAMRNGKPFKSGAERARVADRITERPFAEQKAALWPEHLTGDYSVMDPYAYRKSVNKAVAEGRALDTRQFTEDFKKKGGVVADSAASLISRKSTTPHTTGWLDGYTHVEYDTPHGPVKVLYKNLDTDGNLSIESIDTPALDAGANTRGPTVVRAIANDLQQSTGASTVSGNRISGMAPDRQARRALRPDSLWNLLGRPRE